MLLLNYRAESIEKLETSEQENLSEDLKHTSAVAKIYHQKWQKQQKKSWVDVKIKVSHHLLQM